MLSFRVFEFSSLPQLKHTTISINTGRTEQGIPDDIITFAQNVIIFMKVVVVLYGKLREARKLVTSKTRKLDHPTPSFPCWMI